MQKNKNSESRRCNGSAEGGEKIDGLDGLNKLAMNGYIVGVTGKLEKEAGRAKTIARYGDVYHWSMDMLF
jgi:hypothetical protein